jgi:hypothetical protein
MIQGESVTGQFVICTIWVGTYPTMKRRASGLARKIRAKGGAGMTVDLIEQELGK